MQAAESTQHIFLECHITTRLWEWLEKGIEQNLDCSSCLQLILGSLGIGSKLVQNILNSVIIHTIWAIWIERNQRRFHNKQQAMSTTFNIILAEVKTSYSLSLIKGDSAIQDYRVAKLFNIPFKVKRSTPSQEVVWRPPSAGFVKINCDGSSIGSHPCGSLGIVLRDSSADFLGAIASNIGHASSVEAEFSASMLDLEKAKEMHLSHICLETDSLKVVVAFNKGLGFLGR